MYILLIKLYELRNVPFIWFKAIDISKSSSSSPVRFDSLHYPRKLFILSLSSDCFKDIASRIIIIIPIFTYNHLVKVNQRDQAQRIPEQTKLPQHYLICKDKEKVTGSVCYK